MDALSEVLRVIRLDSAIYLNAECSEPWCVTTPEARKLAPVLSRRDAHLIIYHLLCDGRAYAEIEGGERVSLCAGDIVTFPHGHPHVLGGGPPGPSLDAAAALPGVLARGLDPLRFGGGGPGARLICGFLACDAQLSQAFLGGLPAMIRVHVRDDPSGQWLENSLKFFVTQAANREAGAAAMLTKLSEVAFADTLRRYASHLPEGQTGWLSGARDPEVGKALTLLHHRPDYPWTVTNLAHEIGLSKTVLADRFRQLIGEPPMAYLTRWRLRLGARALTATTRSVAEIAGDAGYDSEATFNRAFKREFGVPPARYRRERGSAGQRVASNAG